MAADAGVTEFEISPPGSGTDITINEFAGGYVEAQANGTPGYSYEIMANDILDMNGSPTMTVRIFGNTAVALSTSDDLALIKHPAKDVVIAPTTLLSPTLGVCLTAQAADQFGWVGVKGPHTVYFEGTVVDGAEVRHSETTAGSVAGMDYTESTAESDSGPIGRLRNYSGTTTFGLVDLYGKGIV